MTNWMQVLGSALLSRSEIPRFELHRGNVRSPNGRLRPFDPARGFSRDPLCPQQPAAPAVIRLSGWRLCHAVRVADCQRRLPMHFLSVLGLLLETVGTLDWRSTQLRTLAGTSTAYNDFSGTSLAGRIGQGLAILFMQDVGYRFVSHYPRSPGSTGPDFILETSAGVRALVEAKGSFLRLEEEPNLKGELSGAIGQLGAATMPHSKEYAVASYLREEGDPSEEPSMVAYVDPDRDDVVRGRPSDEGVRSAYAGWLRGHGLVRAAADLLVRRSSREPEAVALPVIDIAGVPFALFTGPVMHRWLAPPFGFVAGLDARVLRLIERTLREPGFELSQGLPAGLYSGSATDELSPDGGSSGFVGSIFADGSLLGQLPLDKWSRGERMEFQL